MTGSENGWLEAAIAWEVCASLHRHYCKGKDALFTTRQSDFVTHAEDARDRASRGQAPAQPDFTTLGAAIRAIRQAIELIGEPVDDRMRTVRRVLRGAVIVSEDSEDIPAQPAPSTDSVQEDAARLDWLDQNIFHREMGEWDAKYGGLGNYNMWVMFAPKGAQGSARNILDAARKQGGSHD